MTDHPIELTLEERELILDVLKRTMALRKAMHQMVITVMAGLVVALLLHLPSPIPWPARTAIIGVWLVAIFLMVIRVRKEAKGIRLLAAITLLTD
jgi:hypothetical protein